MDREAYPLIWVLQCYNPHKHGDYCGFGCYKRHYTGATEVLQIVGSVHCQKQVTGH